MWIFILQDLFISQLNWKKAVINRKEMLDIKQFNLGYFYKPNLALILWTKVINNLLTLG